MRRSRLRARGRARASTAPRLQVSHLKCASRAVHGRAAEAVAVLEAARAEGLDVGADQYPYTAAATTLTTILPPALLGLGMEACVAALGDRDVRDRVRSEIERGISGWENVGRDPGWDGIRISWSASHPDWAGRSLARARRGAFDARPGRRRVRRAGRRPARRLDRHRLHDAGGRRRRSWPSPGSPCAPTPPAGGRATRCSTRAGRTRGRTAPPPACSARTSASAGPSRSRPRSRSSRRCRPPASACAIAACSARVRSPTSSCSIPTTVADVATYEDPAPPPGRDRARRRQRPRSRSRDGAETGERPGRLLRHAA